MMRSSRILAAVSAALIRLASAQDCLSCDAKRAATVGRSMRVNGQVGGADWRVVSTDRSYNYKLRATWLTPDSEQLGCPAQTSTR